MCCRARMNSQSRCGRACLILPLTLKSGRRDRRWPMSVKALLPNAFQKHTNNVREIDTAAANLPELVTDLEGRFPALRQHLRGEDGQVRKFINFYVNEEDIRFLGNEKYEFQDGDEVLVIPSIAGG